MLENNCVHSKVRDEASYPSNPTVNVVNW